MRAEIYRSRFLDQEHAAATIEQRFGPAFVRVNDSGNLAIARPVLAAFRAMTEREVVWDRADRLWRFRGPGDRPHGRQAD
jgi:hypothetical protein